MRSRRTVRTSGEDRSWFGRPQAIKKGGRECRQQQGDERVENTENHSQQHHSLELVKGALDAVYELPKKGAVPPAPSSTHHPLAKGSNRRVTEEIPTSRRHYDQTTTGVSNPRKSRGPTLCSVRRIHLLRMMLFYVLSVTLTYLVFSPFFRARRLMWINRTVNAF